MRGRSIQRALLDIGALRAEKCGSPDRVVTSSGPPLRPKRRELRA
jgi:hypothetical protein